METHLHFFLQRNPASSEMTRFWEERDAEIAGDYKLQFAEALIGDSPGRLSPRESWDWHLDGKAPEGWQFGFSAKWHNVSGLNTKFQTKQSIQTAFRNSLGDWHHHQPEGDKNAAKSLGNQLNRDVTDDRFARPDVSRARNIKISSISFRVLTAVSQSAFHQRRGEYFLVAKRPLKSNPWLIADKLANHSKWLGTTKMNLVSAIS